MIPRTDRCGYHWMDVEIDRRIDRQTDRYGQTDRQTDVTRAASSCCVSYQCQHCRRCIIHDEASRWTMLSAILFLFILLFLILLLIRLSLLVLLLNLLVTHLQLLLPILFLHLCNQHVFFLACSLSSRCIEWTVVSVLQVAVECSARWQICFNALNCDEMDANRQSVLQRPCVGGGALARSPATTLHLITALDTRSHITATWSWLFQVQLLISLRHLRRIGIEWECSRQQCFKDQAFKIFGNLCHGRLESRVFVEELGSSVGRKAARRLAKSCCNVSETLLKTSLK